MENTKIAAIIAGVGVALVGVYLMADGITGYVGAPNDGLLNQTKIPIGLLVATVGIAGAVVMERVVSSKKHIEAEGQHMESAPLSSFGTVEIKPSQMSEQKVLAPTTVQSMPTVQTIARPIEDVSNPLVQVSMPSDEVKIEKPRASDFKKKAKKASKKATKKTPARKVAKPSKKKKR